MVPTQAGHDLMSEADLAFGVKLATDDDDTGDALSGTTDYKYTAISPWQFVGSAVRGTGTGDVLVLIPGPAQGRWFEVMQVVVTGSDDVTAVGTSVALYRTTAQSFPIPLTDLVRPASIAGVAQIAPLAVTFGRRILPMIYPQTLAVVVHGVAAGAQVVVTVQGWDRDVEDMHDWSQVPNTKPITRAG